MRNTTRPEPPTMGIVQYWYNTVLLLVLYNHHRNTNQRSPPVCHIDTYSTRLHAIDRVAAAPHVTVTVPVTNAARSIPGSHLWHVLGPVARLPIGSVQVTEKNWVLLHPSFDVLVLRMRYELSHQYGRASCRLTDQ